MPTAESIKEYATQLNGAIAKVADTINQKRAQEIIGSITTKLTNPDLYDPTKVSPQQASSNFMKGILDMQNIENKLPLYSFGTPGKNYGDLTKESSANIKTAYENIMKVGEGHQNNILTTQVYKEIYKNDPEMSKTIDNVMNTPGALWNTNFASILGKMITAKKETQPMWQLTTVGTSKSGELISYYQNKHGDPVTGDAQFKAPRQDLMEPETGQLGNVYYRAKEGFDPTNPEHWQMYNNPVPFIATPNSLTNYNVSSSTNTNIQVDKNVHEFAEITNPDGSKETGMFTKSQLEAKTQQGATVLGRTDESRTSNVKVDTYEQKQQVKTLNTLTGGDYNYEDYQAFATKNGMTMEQLINKARDKKAKN